MLKGSRAIPILVLVLVVIAAVAPSKAKASAPFYWEYINVDIEVKDNGDMWVTEEHRYVFTAAHTNQRYRWLPLDHVDGIDNIAVFEDGKKLNARVQTKNGKIWINWTHQLNAPESHTFLLKYRVRGGLRINRDRDQLYWAAIFAGRRSPIHKSTVTVHLPAALTGKILSKRSSGVPTKVALIDQNTVQFISHGEPIKPDQHLKVRIDFPHGILPIERPKWQGVESNTDVTGFFVVVVIFMIIALAIPAIRGKPWGSGGSGFSGGGSSGGGSGGGGAGGGGGGG